ncbi:MAG: serine hydrolase [Candidatus Moduliflexus flocculans]|nr:serine hydrolase [Candidatus Moduliflexus flocculans]
MTSILVGIAIEQGLIKAVREPVLGFFTDLTAANLDERKMAMTLEHLLLMQSGLACVSSPSEETLFRMMAAPDWVRYMLDLPMSHTPGTRFSYNSGAVHLLPPSSGRAPG